MAARITPLRLEAFEQLPKHARRCVYWEVDPLTVGAEGHLSDPEFEKEAWLSMVMLEWGSCGQLAVDIKCSSGSLHGTCISTVSLYALKVLDDKIKSQGILARLAMEESRTRLPFDKGPIK